MKKVSNLLNLLHTKTDWITGLGICSIGRTGVPLRTSRKRTVQSLLQMSTNLAHSEKFTTGEPMYVSHSGVLFDTNPVTFEIGPAAVDVKLF